MKLLEKSGNFVSPGKERTILFRSNLGRYIIYISQHLSAKSYYLSEKFWLFCVVICHCLTVYVQNIALILFDQPLVDLCTCYLIACSSQRNEMCSNNLVINN